MPFHAFFLILFFFSFSVRAEGIVLTQTECEKKLVDLIESASEYIDVSVYAINNKPLTDALIAAHRRGVRLRVLTDRTQAAGPSSRVWDLIDAGVPLRVHSHKKIMHTKVGIYDGRSVSSGSLNWTEPAVHKNEEVCDIFVDDPDYAAQHQKLFDLRWEANSPEKSDEWIEARKKERDEEKKHEKAVNDVKSAPHKKERKPGKTVFGRAVIGPVKHAPQTNKQKGNGKNQSKKNSGKPF